MESEREKMEKQESGKDYQKERFETNEVDRGSFFKKIKGYKLYLKSLFIFNACLEMGRKPETRIFACISASISLSS